MGNRLNFFQKPVFSIWLYVLVSFLAFSPCLLFKQAYFDNDLLAQFGPWRAYLRDQLAQGHFPLWNPFLLGGQPFFADLQNMMFYPFNYLTLPFSVPYGLSLFFFLHFFWSALGMHLWLRSWGLSENACRTGSLLFASSGFFWLEIIHPPVLAAYSWLPWFFWALEILTQSPRPRHAFYTGFAFAMLFLCGSFQVTVGSLYGGAVYFLFRFYRAQWKGKDTRLFPPSVLNLAFLALFLLWGALPLLAQFIPTLEFAKLSDRLSSPQTYGQLDSQLSLDPGTLYQFLVPRLTLPAQQGIAEAVQSRDPKVSFSANWGYLGVWIPFLAYGAFRGKQRKLAGFLLFFVLLALGICLGKYLPLHDFFWNYLPGFSIIRVAYRFLYLYVLGLAALAALGFESLAVALQKAGTNKKIFLTGLAYAFVLYLVCLFRPVQNGREILALFLGLLGMGVCFWTPFQKKAGIFIFQASLILPLFLSGWADFVPGPSSNFDYEKNSKSLSEMAGHLGPNRVIFDNIHMFYPIQVGGQKYLLNYPQDASCALRIKNFGGYNPLMLQVKRDFGTLSMDALIRLGAIRGILTQEGHGEIPGFKAVSFPPFLFYEYQKPLDYVFTPASIETVVDKDKRLAQLNAPGFDPYVRGILSEPLPPGIENQISKDGKTRLQYRIVVDDPDRQRFEVGLDRDALVVFADTMFPGWKARVDGQPSAIFTADHLLRSVYLPAGRHEVEFRFEPGWYNPIRLGLAAWLAITLGGFFFLKFYSKGKILA
jgi:hypothetical protein